MNQYSSARGTNAHRRESVGFGRTSLAAATAAVLAVAGLSLVLATTQRASAATSIGLGTSGQFAVLAGAGVTNTGSTTIQTQDAGVRGDVGTYPNNTVTGDASISWIPPAAGTLHKADAVAQIAQADNLAAYAAAAGAASTESIGGQLDGAEYLTGVYTASSALNLATNGTVTFNAQGDPDAVFIVQVGSSLTMEVNSTVALINGAQACHIFWQVSDDATIKTNATFVGTVLAENAIVAQSGATFKGRLLAQDASVTLDHNTFTMPDCSPLVTATTPTETTPTPTETTPTPTETTPTPTETTPTPTETTPTPTETTPTPTETTPTPTETTPTPTETTPTPTETTPTPTETTPTPTETTPTATRTTPAPVHTSTTPGGGGPTDYTGTPGTETSNEDTLPDTGGPWIGWFPIGLGALLAGAGTIYLGIRRRGTRTA
ncbi:MAG: cytoskeleton protein RodZ [Aeromicrobium sp.]|nr:cytoskeleton protein RodZ [Aeromicrobium sp.]